jgi:hypothetical protein
MGLMKGRNKMPYKDKEDRTEAVRRHRRKKKEMEVNAAKANRL